MRGRKRRRTPLRRQAITALGAWLTEQRTGPRVFFPSCSGGRSSRTQSTDSSQSTPRPAAAEMRAATVSDALAGLVTQGRAQRTDTGYVAVAR